MLTLYSDSFITAARMDGFSYVQGRAGKALRTEAPDRTEGPRKSLMTRVLAALRLV